jgi:next-to-BRCA1 protein 1
MHPSCPDFDLCEKCEALPIPVHPESHALLKLKMSNIPIPTLHAPEATNQPTAEPRRCHGPIRCSGNRTSALRQSRPYPYHLPADTSCQDSGSCPQGAKPSPGSPPYSWRTLHPEKNPKPTDSEQGVSYQVPVVEGAKDSLRCWSDTFAQAEPEQSPSISGNPPLGRQDPPSLLNGRYGEILCQSVDVTSEISTPEPPVVPAVLSNTDVDSPLAEAALLKGPISPRKQEMPEVDLVQLTRQNVSLAALLEEEPSAPSVPSPPSSVIVDIIDTQLPAAPPSLDAKLVLAGPLMQDGQAFPPGAEFIKSWRMLNIGANAWPATTKLVFVAGARLAIRDHQYPVHVGALDQGGEMDIWSSELKVRQV